MIALEHSNPAHIIAHNLSAGDRPYRDMCVAAVSAALSADVLFELAVTQFAEDRRGASAGNDEYAYGRLVES